MKISRDLNSQPRKPGSIVWIVVAGRLKRCSPQQLRHCSEREKILEGGRGHALVIQLPHASR